MIYLKKSYIYDFRYMYMVLLYVCVCFIQFVIHLFGPNSTINNMYGPFSLTLNGRVSMSYNLYGNIIKVKTSLFLIETIDE